MLLRTIIAALGQIAPPEYAEAWDNVGLLAGDPAQLIHHVLFTIDYTAEVADEARNLNCDLIVAYHPPIFSGIKRITADGPSALIHQAIARGAAIYSPHTAWDAAPGGTNDLLADAIGLTDRQPLRIIMPEATVLKLVTFVPQASLQAVSDAVFAAGAGHLGNYSHCSFQTQGTGTFKGELGSNPVVGQVGRLEITPEVKLETILPRNRVEPVIAALRKAHPYEEPAFDLTVLAAPKNGIGPGRIGELASAVSVAELVARLKRELNLSTLLLAGQEERSVKRIALCAGAGGELLDDAINRGAEVYLTGEIRHHDAIKAKHAGMTTICTLHSNSERPSLTRLLSRLEQALENQAEAPQLLLSRADRDPFVFR